MWSSYIQAEIFLRNPEDLSLPRRINSRHRKYLGTLVIPTIDNAGYNVDEQLHIDIEHNFLQEIDTIWHCREGKDQHIACPDVNVHRRTHYSVKTQITNTQ